MDEQRQSTIITQALWAAAGRERVGPVFVYAVRDAGSDPADREDNFGLLRRDFSAKPAWDALVELLADPLP